MADPKLLPVFTPEFIFADNLTKRREAVGDGIGSELLCTSPGELSVREMLYFLTSCYASRRDRLAGVTLSSPAHFKQKPGAH